MRMLMNVRIPHEPFNILVKQGKAGEIIQRILDDLKPESIYFTEQGGTRRAAGLASEYKINRIPYDRRSPAAFCRELQFIIEILD